MKLTVHVSVKFRIFGMTVKTISETFTWAVPAPSVGTHILGTIDRFGILISGQID